MIEDWVVQVGRFFRRTRRVAGVNALLCILLFGGCSPPCFENFGFVPLVDMRGVLLDDATGMPLAGADVGFQLFDENGAVALSILPNGIRHPEMFVTRDDGSFQFTPDRSTACLTIFGVIVDLPLPVVARIEIVVLRDTCESRFAFDVNEANIENPSAPDGLLELREPIVVPECVP